MKKIDKIITKMSMQNDSEFFNHFFSDLIEKINCHSFGLSWEKDFGWKVSLSNWDSSTQDMEKLDFLGGCAKEVIIDLVIALKELNEKI